MMINLLKERKNVRNSRPRHPARPRTHAEGSKCRKEENIKRNTRKKTKNMQSKLKKHVDSIRELSNCSELPWVSLQLARDDLFKLKDEFTDTSNLLTNGLMCKTE